jgi:uncharacterized protein (TIGR03435 family)
MHVRPRHAFALVTPIGLLASIALIAPHEALSSLVSVHVSAQAPAPVEFDVVSIKRHASLDFSGGMRTMPDGTFVMTNATFEGIVLFASPVQTRDVEGLPPWSTSERYDLTAKPPAGSTLEQRREMWRALFANRMNLVAHVEQRERDSYALVPARHDGRLGPGLKRSTLDCTPRQVGTAPPSPTAPSIQERQNRCGMSMSAGLIVSGGVAMDQFVANLRGLAGGEVENRTGLEGQYALTLRFSVSRELGAAAVEKTDDAPDFFTAIQEQLGLKLQHEKRMMPVFVIDHIERPSEN